MKVAMGYNNDKDAFSAGKKRLRETEKLSSLINRLRETESALEKMRDELEKRVAERTAELVKTNELLKQEIAERKQAAL
jgi:C4-dicarboxylate-specific signal transduction histidine kinase